MNIDQLRKFCLAFPGATEQVQWKDDLLFKERGIDVKRV
jgi:predicted DNA-binding protein (MmcQ/YjbR family)